MPLPDTRQQQGVERGDKPAHDGSEVIASINQRCQNKKLGSLSVCKPRA